MILTIKNLGMIDEAKIELNGITVIAGKNNTGKSTVSKALFCVVSSFYNVENVISTSRFEALAQRLLYEEVTKSIIKNTDVYKSDKIKLTTFLTKYKYEMLGSPSFAFDEEKEDMYFEKKINELADYIMKILNTSDDEVMQSILLRKFSAEFGMQMNNIHGDNDFSEIILEFTSKKISVKIQSVHRSHRIKISNIIGINVDAIYIDDPMVLDLPQTDYPRRRSFKQASHRNHLHLLLIDNDENTVLNELHVLKKLDKVFDLINNILPGEMMSEEFGDLYVIDKFGGKINVSNLSTGLKSFVIIKTLLLKGKLKEGGIIILDEPEVHLHPEWQLTFAEIIVLLQKLFNVRVLINTHSPYFMMALEDYSKIHGIDNKCKYYLAESDVKIATIKDVSDNTKKVYTKFLEPLRKLDEVRYVDDKL